MKIKSIAETSYSGMYKVVEENGAVFFVRKEYIPDMDFARIEAGTEFDEEESGKILDAGLVSVIELKAVEYLGRSEQSRFGLTLKLLKKKYDKKYIETALDYLENNDYLSDQRFARAWLHLRSLKHYEGRTRLLSELISRGISKEISTFALDEFFSEHDEMEICKRAYETFLKQGKEGEKLISAMIRAGFSYKMIKLINQ